MAMDSSSNSNTASATPNDHEQPGTLDAKLGLDEGFLEVGQHPLEH